MVKKEDKLLAWILLLTLALIWGSSFILMKKGLRTFAPDQLASLRMSISFMCLLPVVLTRFKQVQKSHWKYLMAAGILGNGIPAFLFAIAQTHISSSVAGMLNGLTPVFVLILGWWFFKVKTSGFGVAGVLMGLSGAIALLFIRSSGTVSSDPKYGLLIVLATVCYGFSANIIRSKLHVASSILITAFVLSFVGPPSMVYLFSTDFLHRMCSEGAWLDLGYIAILAVFGTALSTVLFNRLLKITTAVFASTVTYMIPVVAMLWGLLDGERIGVEHLASLLVIFTGVYLASRK
ncbi:MAG TPA: DMT family transporter [Bacteroidia bacterium]|nr:DMT family transporter [Bacteroidia bacterium]HNT79997.1 DMT family transporter [Bacteroidia bacterium]